MAQAAPAPSIRSLPSGKLDLTAARPCGTQASTNDDVIVCGRRRDESARYRLPPPTPYESALPKAEVKLGNGTKVVAETENFDIGGRPSKRIMVRLKFKF
ncbi:MAG: hypothetical protein M3Q88_04415 [Pseudomonadota bacterium]|nr:hypothetical protein [Pseudomonadota bacterium]